MMFESICKLKLKRGELEIFQKGEGDCIWKKDKRLKP